jgi:hypothetical protein
MRHRCRFEQYLSVFAFLGAEPSAIPGIASVISQASNVSPYSHSCSMRFRELPLVGQVHGRPLFEVHLSIRILVTVGPNQSARCSHECFRMTISFLVSDGFDSQSINSILSQSTPSCGWGKTNESIQSVANPFLRARMIRTERFLPPSTTGLA